MPQHSISIFPRLIAELTFNPPSVPANEEAEAEIDLPGVRTDMFLTARLQQSLDNLFAIHARSEDDNKVKVLLKNVSGAAIDLAEAKVTIVGL